MYDGEKLETTKLKVDLHDYEETLKDAEKIRLKMKDKMIQLDYAKLNALFESFVPQTEIPAEQTYFSSPSTSNVSSESRIKKELLSMTSKMRLENILLSRIKLEFQNLFNSIKATRVQHQQEVNELIENVNQKTYAYGDVRAKNQDLLMTISELKAKLKLAEKGKNVNTKFDKSATLEKLMCVASSSSVKRQESKDTNSKKRVLLNTKSKSTPKDVKKSQTKTINAVHDGSNLVCVSCGKDVFMLSHDKCVAHYALSPNPIVNIALFTSPVAAKSSKLGATPVVAKSRFSVATPSKATNKVSRATSLTP
ncbi:hypothetical protein Tco_0944134 [Tanacetum coccineum]